jgi:hypothetical protein
MRFVHQNGQRALQFTVDWEVDMLSKLPENEWVPITYVGETRPIGAIHVGTLAVHFLDGHPAKPELPFIMQCRYPKSQEALRLKAETPVVSQEMREKEVATRYACPGSVRTESAEAH